MFEKLKSKFNRWFNPANVVDLETGATPVSTPSTHKSDIGGLYWWRNSSITPAMQHKLRNDKRLMYMENPLLQNLILRHHKEIA